MPDHIRLHVSPSQTFSGFEKSFNDSSHVILGVPFDRTSTYRGGSKFGPSAIREASLNIETYSIRSKFDLEDVQICDIGDLHVTDLVDETLSRLSLVEKAIIAASKMPVALGGEHTISLGAIRALGNDVGVVCLDAHADMRDEYMGHKVMHATFLRRVIEDLGPGNVVHVGLRAICREELTFIEKNHLTHFPMHDLKRHGVREAADLVGAAIADFKKIYITIDIDVVDPGFAPGVGNPEPDGMWPDLCLTILSRVCDKRLAGLDVVEVSPHYDNGITAALAAKLVFEAICATEASRGKVVRQ